MKKARLLVLVILMVCLASVAAAGRAAENGVTVGKNLTPFTLPALDGQNVTVAPSGKVMIVNFWATWCPPCRREMPELNDFFQKYEGKLLFYAVNLQEPPSKVNDFMYQNHYSLPTLTDTSGAVGSLYQIQYIPTTIVVDRSGVIQFRSSGAITGQALEEIVKKYL